MVEQLSQGRPTVKQGAPQSAETWIAERQSRWERRLDRLGDYLGDAASSGPPRTPDKTHHHHLDQPEENQ